MNAKQFESKLRNIIKKYDTQLTEVVRIAKTPAFLNPIADKYFFLLRETSPWRTRWDFFIILTAFYIIFLNPYDVAFMVRDRIIFDYLD